MKTSKDIIDSVSRKLPYSKEVIRKVVNNTFAEVKDRMENKEKIMLRGFIKFVCATNKKTKKYTLKEYQKLKTKNK